MNQWNLKTDIYFIRCGWLVKMGRSRGVLTRVGEIELPSPEEPVLVGLLEEVSAAKEHNLHYELKRSGGVHVYNEWYVWCPFIENFMQRIGARPCNRPLGEFTRSRKRDRVCLDKY
jgi:hypothetical protein